LGNILSSGSFSLLPEGEKARVEGGLFYTVHRLARWLCPEGSCGAV